MIKKTAIVIPFYKNNLSAYENIALQQCGRVLSAHIKIAVKPDSLTLPPEANQINFNEVICFDDGFFKGLAGYNRLMLSAEFYNRFIDYEYVLIYQMDCFVFKDELNYWCDQDFDYIGAPWIRKTYHKNLLQLSFFRLKQCIATRFNWQNNNVPNKYQFENIVGNGGFSLRRVKKFADLCTIMKPMIDFYLSQKTNLYNEDVFWSIEVNREKRVLNIPSFQTGLKFAFEVPPVKAKKLNEQNLPFGCHDWDKYANFWRPIFKLYNYNI